MKAVLFIRIAFACLLLGIVGCKQNNTQTRIQNDSIDSAAEPWFCQLAEQTDDWDCIRSKRLAASPEPRRLPKAKPAQNASEFPNSVAPENPTIALDQRSSKPFEISTSNRGLEVPGNESSPPSENANPESTRSTAQTQQPLSQQSAEDAEADIPAHIRLAYRPESAVSLLDLPDEFWAVQLLAVSSKDALEQFAAKHQLRGMSAAEVISDDKIYYVLLLGIYETRDRAVRAAEGLPAPLDEPWIRSLASLKSGMQAAEALRLNN